MPNRGHKLQPFASHKAVDGVVSSVVTGYEDDLPLEFSKWKSRITETKYPSGMRWLHVDYPESRSVQWTVSIQAGSYDEVNNPQRKFSEGTAHLLEHSIFLRMTPEDKTLFNYWNAYTSSRNTVYTFETSYENTPKTIGIIFENLLNFRENPASLDEVKAVNSE